MTINDTATLVPAGETFLAPPSLSVGDLTVTALADGYFDLPAPFLMKAGNSFADAPATLHLDVNAFLITTGGRRILVDTGCGAQLGPTVNQVVPQLLLAGVTTEEIDAVLCTHIHPDHTNGLIDAAGAAQFANAEVFVHQRELDFWLSEEQMATAPESLKGQFVWAREAFAPYAGRISPFEAGHVLDRIEAVPLFGHTPGHSGFLVDGGGTSQLMIWGDSVHVIEIQARDPDVTVIADTDPEAARAARRRLFDQVAADDMLFAGMHVGFPGFGRLARDGQGFEFAPAG